VKPKTANTTRRLVASIIRIASLVALGAIFASPVVAQDCPAGQTLVHTWAPDGMVRIVMVPGKAGGMPSGIVMQPGKRYDMTATGSIRVGIFGETGTPPDGWVPQGSAGPGAPDPDAYAFSLLYRNGPNGMWQLLGSGHSIAYLGPKDPPGTQIEFGINDTKLDDNDGFFNVVVVEQGPITKCETVAPPQPGPLYGSVGTSTTTSHSQPTNHPPCAGITPNGMMQDFNFSMVCPGQIIMRFSESSCTASAARGMAAAQAKSDNCLLQ